MKILVGYDYSTVTQDVLALAPFGKVPVLESAVDGWSALSPYFENYSDETMAQIAGGYDTMQRWLFRPDYDTIERAVVGDIEGRLLIPQAISNIALEGTMTPETAAEWLQEQVEAIEETFRAVGNVHEAGRETVQVLKETQPGGRTAHRLKPLSGSNRARTGDSSQGIAERGPERCVTPKLRRKSGHLSVPA